MACEIAALLTRSLSAKIDDRFAATVLAAMGRMSHDVPAKGAVAGSPLLDGQWPVKHGHEAEVDLAMLGVIPPNDSRVSFPRTMRGRPLGLLIGTGVGLGLGLLGWLVTANADWFLAIPILGSSLIWPPWKFRSFGQGPLRCRGNPARPGAVTTISPTLEMRWCAHVAERRLISLSILELPRTKCRLDSERRPGCCSSRACRSGSSRHPCAPSIPELPECCGPIPAGGNATSESGPEISSPEEIWKFVQLGSAIATDYSPDGARYVQLFGNCTWEEEHGLEICLRDGASIVYLGQFRGYHDHYAANPWNYAPDA